MRPPPPLLIEGRASRAWRVLCMLSAGAAAATFSAWTAAHAQWQPMPMVLAALLAGLAGAAAGTRLARLAGPQRDVRIGWDGAAWKVDGLGGDLQLMLDLGPVLLLLRLKPASGFARWFALSSARGAGELHALRTALYSRPLNRPAAASPATPRVRAPDRATD